VIDGSSGTQTDLPTAVRVGFGPGAWGNTAGTVTFDAVSVRDSGSGAGTGTATPTPTATSTSTPTSTVSATSTATPTSTSTPTTTGGAVLVSDGFEGSTFASTGWATDVSGSGASATLVTSPVFAGNQAASFTTQTQQSGQHAFVEHAFTWPISQAATAEAEVVVQNAAVQFFSKILSLETHGPNNWGARAGYALGPSSFWVLYTTRDGASHQVDIGQPYATGQWYDLAVTVDYSGSNPVLTWRIAGQTVYSVIDMSSGTQTDLPTAVRLGFGPGAWGNTAGTVTFDAVSVRD